jgi:two-component system, LytTR family, response regulator
MRLKALLVDDEELSRQLLREYLAGQSDIEIAGECANGFDAVKAIQELQPDIVFLDVQMPKLDGFEVLELIQTKAAIVFVTAYDQYATKAFDAAAVDYLLKPFDEARFLTALNRVRRRLAENANISIDPKQLKSAAKAPGQFAERIVVKDGTRVHIIPIRQVDFVEAQEDYVAIHTGGKTFLKQQTISSLEETLDASQYIRVHRSYIVSLEQVSKIEPYTRDSRIAVLKNGAQVPISRAGYLRLREAMER